MLEERKVKDFILKPEKTNGNKKVVGWQSAKQAPNPRKLFYFVCPKDA